MENLDQKINFLSSKYYDYHKISDIADKDALGTASILPFEDLQFVVYFFKWWTPLQDALLDEVEEYSTKYADLLIDRGLTLKEFKYIIHSSLEEEEYIENRVCQYLFIGNKQEHRDFKYFNTKDAEDEDFVQAYVKAIKEQITSDSSLLYEFFFASRVARKIAKSRLKRHVYIPAGSGSGKSEIIKYIFHELIKDKKLNVNLIEPHQDLSLEVLQFSLIKKNRKRLIYLDPTIQNTARLLTRKNIIKDDVKFIINPFDLKGINDFEIEGVIEELRIMFFSLLSNDVTENMELVIDACIEVLLRAGEQRETPYSIADLKRFMSHSENEDLIKIGTQVLKNTDRKKVMLDLSDEREYKSQRGGIYKRLGKILGKENFKRLVVGKSTVDLGKAMNSGKIVICNFSKSPFGKESGSILGKFVISLMNIHATKRANIEKKYRRSSFTFIDECQRFLTSTVGEIMEEARKYNLFMILANQYIGQQMSTELKDSIMTNSGLKIAGVMNKKSIEAVAGEMFNVTSKDFHQLEPYQFFLYDNKYREMGTQKIKVPDYLVKKGRPFYMKKKALRDLLLWVVDESGYYIKATSEQNKQLKQADKTQSNYPSRTKIIYDPKFDD